MMPLGVAHSDGDDSVKWIYRIFIYDVETRLTTQQGRDLRFHDLFRDSQVCATILAQAYQHRSSLKVYNSLSQKITLICTAQYLLLHVNNNIFLSQCPNLNYC